MFKVKYGLNKIHFTIIANQLGWFDGKGINTYPIAIYRLGTLTIYLN
jgi:hypothetical protein